MKKNKIIEHILAFFPTTFICFIAITMIPILTPYSTIITSIMVFMAILSTIIWDISYNKYLNN